jgi:hypothetical protein
MDKIEFAQGLGERTIKSQHDSFVSDGEDLSHITNLKRIIVAISEHLRSCSKAPINFFKFHFNP